MPGQNPFDDFVNMIGGAVRPVSQGMDWMENHPPMEYLKGLYHGLAAMGRQQQQPSPALGVVRPGTTGADIALPPQGKKMARKKKSSMGNAAASLPGIQPPGVE